MRQLRAAGVLLGLDRYDLRTLMRLLMGAAIILCAAGLAGLGWRFFTWAAGLGG